MKLKELQTRITPLPWPKGRVPRGEFNLNYACYCANHLPKVLEALKKLDAEVRKLPLVECDKRWPGLYPAWSEANEAMNAAEEVKV